MNKLKLIRFPLFHTGYRLSQKFYTFIGVKYNLVGDRGINFDDFIYVILMITLITRIFSSLDYKRENEIDLNYEQFLNTYMDITSI